VPNLAHTVVLFLGHFINMTLWVIMSFIFTQISMTFKELYTSLILCEKVVFTLCGGDLAGAQSFVHGYKLPGSAVWWILWGPVGSLRAPNPCLCAGLLLPLGDQEGLVPGQGLVSYQWQSTSERQGHVLCQLTSVQIFYMIVSSYCIPLSFTENINKH
jgi:hypothetical protein